MEAVTGVRVITAERFDDQQGFSELGSELGCVLKPEVVPRPPGRSHPVENELSGVVDWLRVLSADARCRSESQDTTIADGGSEARSQETQEVRSRKTGGSGLFQLLTLLLRSLLPPVD